jgi:Uma2 family endonuclease
MPGRGRSLASRKGELSMATDLRKTKRRAFRPTSEPELTWEIARLFPAQGDWTEEEYFALDNNHRVEYSDGFLEFLPMPTIFHQLILQYVYDELKSFITAGALGTVVISGYKVRLRAGKFREPDILFIRSAHRSGIKEQYCEKADLVIEFVSDQNRPHDIKTKRVEYAKAGIPEYWIIDPERQQITVLVLRPRQRAYTEFGVFRKAAQAASKRLPGFTIDVTTAFSQKP